MYYKTCIIYLHPNVYVFINIVSSEELEGIIPLAVSSYVHKPGEGNVKLVFIFFLSSLGVNEEIGGINPND
jgi:hypothetical protein